MKPGKQMKDFENTATLPLISSLASLKYLQKNITESEIVDLLSDIKHRIFPRPFERLSMLRERKDLVGVEIGVAGGEHALSLLKTLDIKKLYLIDPYELYTEYQEGKLHYGVDQLRLSDTEALAREKLAEYGDRIQWVRKLSSEALPEIREKLDFVYIDGNHEENFVIEDIENYYPLLSSNGVIGGHDYYNGFQREHDGVVNAVTLFLSSKSLQLRVELPD
jgi:hypothetical protein